MIKNFRKDLKSFLALLISSISILEIIGSLVTFIVIIGFLILSKQVLSQQTTEIDNAVLQYFFSIQNSVLTRFLIIISFLGKPDILMLITLIFCVFLSVKKQWLMAIVFLFGGLSTNGLSFFLKSVLGRQRPELWERIIEVKYLSYPSAHAMVSIVVYGFICYYLMNQFKSWRWLILILTSTLVILIGISRLYLGVHWLTDIIAGYTAGAVLLITNIMIIKIFKVFSTNRAKLIETE